MEHNAVEVMLAFNDAINRRDLGDLRALMSDDHRFIDSAGGVVAGRDACSAAWASFFESFPDYRNHFDSVDLDASGRAVATGRSECSFGPLDGPARWVATVHRGLVREWRVEDIHDATIEPPVSE